MSISRISYLEAECCDVRRGGRREEQSASWSALQRQHAWHCLKFYSQIAVTRTVVVQASVHAHTHKIHNHTHT